MLIYLERTEVTGDLPTAAAEPAAAAASQVATAKPIQFFILCI